MGTKAAEGADGGEDAFQQKRNPFRWLQQYCALVSKNALVNWRNITATTLRLIAPFLFLILALVIEKALEADTAQLSDYQQVTDPAPIAIDPIPSCNTDVFIGNKPCLDFIYTPGGNVTDPDVEAVVSGMLANNNPPINASRVLGLPSRASANSWMLANPDATVAAIHFWKDPTGNMTFVIQTNTTTRYFKGYFQDPNFFNQLPMISAAQREISRLYLKKEGRIAEADKLNWNPVMFQFPHPTLDTTSILGFVMGPFLFAACMFGFVTQMGSISGEKELGLRQALRNMGMKDSAFWLSWATWDIATAFVVANLIIAYGAICQFDFFLKNDYGLLFLLLFLFQLAMSSLAYVLSVFINKAATAIYLGFFIFLIGWICQTVVVFGVPFSPQYLETAGGALIAIFSALPWCLLSKGTIDLGGATAATESPGIAWDQRTAYCQNVPNPADQEDYNPTQVYRDFNCVMPLSQIFWVLLVDYLVFFVVAVYLDNVWPNENGISRPLWYFLLPSYWLPRGFKPAVALKRSVERDAKGRRMPPPEPDVDDDVTAEEQRMKALLNHRTGQSGGLSEEVSAPAAVELYNLRKVFRQAGGCCRGAQDFWTIRGSWFAIEKDKLFCLLGPNGAGKTTTINCLTGVLPMSGGEALVYGQAIGSEGGMESARSIMGVCPQFDVLWGEVTGREHLMLYGHVKGIPWKEVAQEADRLLEKVKLTTAAKQVSSAYSGGMRRRLSVAIALLGDPKIVYLDEPTTGMDPISRRYVWDIIEQAKVGRAIVLTTHSMEEADILGDRIAIMARGRLRCIGTALRLKQKFGAGYQLAISVMSARGSQQDLVLLSQRAEAVKALVRGALGLEPVDESRAYVTWVVPRTQEAPLVELLAALEARRQELGVTDVQIGLTSLEEVFLTIARKAELDAAAHSGQKTMAVQLDDGSTMQVPVGEEYVMNPLDGKAYHVRWGTDEAGRLVVSEARNVDALPQQQAGAMAPPSHLQAVPPSADA